MQAEKLENQLQQQFLKAKKHVDEGKACLVYWVTCIEKMRNRKDHHELNKLRELK